METPDQRGDKSISRLDGVFGDAPWTNKDRLPDATLKDLIEHYSRVTLSLSNVPEDELGVAYEFLIKKFADSGLKDQRVEASDLVERFAAIDLINMETGLVLAEAGDALTEETVEAIEHAQAASCPIVVAITSFEVSAPRTTSLTASVISRHCLFSWVSSSKMWAMVSPGAAS